MKQHRKTVSPDSHDTPRVLIVDDDEGLTKLLSKNLSRQGLVVETCSSGSEALSIIAKLQTDFLLLDYKLPDMTAKELLDRLNRKNRSIPFLVMTGAGDENVAVKMMKSGAWDYLVKDQHFLEILPSVVQRALLQTTLENELHRVETGLKRSRHHYETLVQLSPVGIFHADPDGRCSYINQRGCALLGMPEKKCLGDGWAETLHPDDRERVWAAWRQAVQQRREFNIECRFVSSDSGEVWVIAHAVPELDDDNNEVIAYICTLMDVTELKTTELKLRQTTEELYNQKNLMESILTSMGDGVIVTNLQGKFTHFNPAAEKILGIGAVNVHPGEWSETYGLFYPDKKRRIPEKELPLFKATKGEEPETTEMFVCNHKKPAGAFINVTVRPLRNDAGKLLGGVAAFSDITRLKQAEERLIESEHRYRRLFEESKDTVFIGTLDGQLIDINPAGVELFGYDSKEALLQKNIGKHLFFNPADRKSYIRSLKQNGFVKDYALTLKKKNGEKLIVQESGVVVRNKWGNIIYHQGIIHNLTERIRLEQQLLQAQKMETIGTLAGGIAHDFNNFLLVILGNVEFAQQDLASSERLRKDLSKIQDAAEQARDLIKQILSFTRQDGHIPEQMDLNTTIQNTINMLHRVIGNKVRLRTHFSENLNTMYADPIQMQQILMNLCVNARDAMSPGGGDIFISTWNVEAVNVNSLNLPQETTSQYIHLQIKDSGIGMDEATQRRIYDPYFTTKKLGQGTGLGLSVVYGIVKKHNGHIEVTSEMGEGTTFNIYLPSMTHISVIGENHGKNISDRRSRRYQTDHT